MSPGRVASAGFVLVEVLVALLVTAVAVLGLTTLQLVQRGGASHARQQGEALRIAQAELERARALDAPSRSAPGLAGGDTDEATDTLLASDTVYSRELTLRAASPALAAATARVTWIDRRGEAQSLVLHTLMSGAAPDLIGARLAERLPWGATPAAPLATALPPGAVDRGNGTHRFEPPGGHGAWWVLDSLSGEVLEVCDAARTCQRSPALLLHGHVRFAPGLEAPGPVQAENPPGPTRPIEVRLQLVRPQPAEVECFESRGDAAVSFHCAVPLPADGPRAWSGRIVLAGLPWAASVADADAAAWRVCRYEPAPAAAPATSATPGLDHDGVTRALLHRNFLVIRAGDGQRAFGCPDDDPATPWLDGRTWHHQPPS